MKGTSLKEGEFLLLLESSSGIAKDNWAGKTISLSHLESHVPLDILTAILITPQLQQ